MWSARRPPVPIASSAGFARIRLQWLVEEHSRGPYGHGNPDIRPQADTRTAQPRAFLPVFLLAYFASAVALLAAGGVSIPLRLAELAPGHKTQALSLTMALGGIAIIAVTPRWGISVTPRHLDSGSVAHTWWVARWSGRWA